MMRQNSTFKCLVLLLALASLASSSTTLKKLSVHKKQIQYAHSSKKDMPTKKLILRSSGHKSDLDFEYDSDELRIILIGREVPKGWKWLSTAEAKQIQDQVFAKLYDWDIVALTDGKVEGKGFGNKFSDSYGEECQHKLIQRIQTPQTPPIQKELRIIPINEEVPEGWKWLSTAEAKQIQDQVFDLMGDWDIVALTDGRVDGRAGGNTFLDSCHRQCGSKLIQLKV